MTSSAHRPRPVLPEHDFRMRWNLTRHGSGWLAHPDSISEIGCIHTAQGIELDYWNALGAVPILAWHRPPCRATFRAHADSLSRTL